MKHNKHLNGFVLNDILRKSLNELHLIGFVSNDILRKSFNELH